MSFMFMLVVNVFIFCCFFASVILLAFVTLSFQLSLIIFYIILKLFFTLFSNYFHS